MRDALIARGAALTKSAHSLNVFVSGLLALLALLVSARARLVN
jgi:hypothetical protein